MDSRLAEKPSLDPLRRVFVPVERRMTNGLMAFRTTDGESYVRLMDGSIRRAAPKVNGEQAKRMRHRG